MAAKLTEKQQKEGWSLVKFSEIAREVKSTTTTPVQDGLKYYVGLEHLEPGSLRISNKGLIEEDSPSFNRLFKTGQILFGKRRCYQKKVAVADFDGICSGDIIVIEAVPGKILPDLLPFIVQSDMFFDHAIKTSSGSLSPRTKWQSLADFEFSLPPLARQKEILKIFAEVENTSFKYNSLINAIDHFMNTALRESFVQKPLRFNPLSQVADVFAGKNDAIDKSLSSGIKMITLPCVNQHCEFSISDEKIAYISANKVTPKDYLKKNDILFNWRNGSKEHVGKTALIDHDMDYVHVGFFLRIRPKDEHISSKYLYWYLRFLKYSEFFSGAKQQVNRTFNKGELLELTVARYSHSQEQKIQILLEHISTMQKNVSNSTQKYNVLRQKLINRILRGY